jgi:hypothetical protein
MNYHAKKVVYPLILEGAGCLAGGIGGGHTKGLGRMFNR